MVRYIVLYTTYTVNKDKDRTEDMVRYIVLYTTYTVNKDKDRGYGKIYYTIYYIYSKQRQGQRIW